MNHLVFLSYGSGPHVDQIRFAVQSAAHRGGADPAAYRVLIVTDDPAPFAGLPATSIEPVDAAQFHAWSQPTGYRHRSKILALGLVLRKYGGSAVMVDSDTYFRRSPAALFDRVGPGRSVMHLCEGQLGHLKAIGYHRQPLTAAAFDLGPAGQYAYRATTPVWNSGVLGVHADDVGRVDEALALNDAIRVAVPINIAEQVAFGSVLARHTRLSPGRDVVFHYHQGFIRDPFNHRLPDLLRETAGLPAADRAAALYRARPAAPTGKRVKAALKRRLKPLGLFKDDLETSV